MATHSEGVAGLLREGSLSQYPGNELTRPREQGFARIEFEGWEKEKLPARRKTTSKVKGLEGPQKRGLDEGKRRNF